MSADNGIYILKTPWVRSESGFQYRVAHLQAIENFEWDMIKGDYTDDQDVWIKNAREMWADAPVFETEHEALKEAFKISDEVEFTEYGVSIIPIDREF